MYVLKASDIQIETQKKQTVTNSSFTLSVSCQNKWLFVSHSFLGGGGELSQRQKVMKKKEVPFFLLKTF